MKKTVKLFALVCALSLFSMTFAACSNNDSSDSDKESKPVPVVSETETEEKPETSVETSKAAPAESSVESSVPAPVESEKEFEEVSELEEESEEEPVEDSYEEPDEESEEEPDEESEEEPDEESEEEPEPSVDQGKSVREAMQGDIGLNMITTMFSQQYGDDNMTITADYEGDDEIVITLTIESSVSAGSAEFTAVQNAMDQYLEEQEATMSQSIQALKASYGVRDFKMTFRVYTSDGTLISAKSYS